MSDATMTDAVPGDGPATIIHMAGISLQSDWVVDKQSSASKSRSSTAPATVWVSAWPGQGEASHGKITFQDGDSMSSSEFTTSDPDLRNIVIGHEGCNVTSSVYTHTQLFKNLFPQGKKCYAFDIAPTLEFGVVGGEDGVMRVFDPSKGTLLKDLQGHVMDVYGAKFFPSSKVILSASADFSMKIWSAVDGSCPVTIRGHQGGVTDTAIIDRGRNIMSCSRDGTAKLWEVASAQCIATYTRESDSATDTRVAAVSLAVCESALDGSRSELSAHMSDAREVGTERALCFVGYDDGVVVGYDVRSRRTVVSFKLDAPATTMLGGVNMLCCGTEGGGVTCVDLRSIVGAEGATQPRMRQFQHRCGAVQRLSWETTDEVVWIAAGDGSCQRLDVSRDTGDATLNYTQLSGPESVGLCGAVFTPGTTEGGVIGRAHVFSACQDGIVRKYVL
eukprot:GFYU01004212.1.p1 GENE.GFYU01004212.1~~GFYU01004212.1.p1  ORF type:complete len:446 (-),score=94.61 GFYU01004212.1:23-1360(-)